MSRADRVCRAIDALSERTGLTVRWLTLLMVLVGAFNAVARYGGRYVGVNLSSNAWLELQWYLFSLVFLLAAPYTLKHGAHVRVDVLHGRFSTRTRAWIELLGSLLFLIPFSIFGLLVSWPTVRNSWAVREGSPDPGGLPRYPIKTAILIGLALLLLQGVAEALRSYRLLRAPTAGDSDAPVPGDHGRGV
ncbi:MAG TPA: TRAP transporter small permease subunit [Thermoanaerobaculia bacterium]|nr:TRAP transporter small permease subunit [Thermoanaerobaculia bacterium]